jgi:hypothetical protein
MTCDLAQGQLALMLYGELSFDEEEHLQQHLDRCPACQRELANLQALHNAFDRIELPIDANLLTSNRRQLRISVAELEHARTMRTGWLTSIKDALASFRTSPLWTPAAACALLVGGFFAGRLVPNATQPIQFARDASPVLATRVRQVEPATEDGRVRLVLEETSQRTLSGDRNDERIRNLLLNAAREAQDPGMRVESVELLKQDVSSEDVRRALIYALQNDPNPGVRLKALEALRAASSNPETRRALSRVVLADENPGIRTQAIDLLVQKKEPEMVGVLQELMQREENSYVRMKCQKALREMKASVETF